MGEQNSATPFLPQFAPPFTSMLPHFNLFLTQFLHQFNLCSAGNLEPRFGNHGLHTLGELWDWAWRVHVALRQRALLEDLVSEEGLSAAPSLVALVAQCSATPASVAATPPCSSYTFSEAA